MKEFSVSLIFVVLASLSIVLAQAFRQGGPGQGGHHGPGRGGGGPGGQGQGGGPGGQGQGGQGQGGQGQGGQGQGGGQPMSEAEFMKMPSPPAGQKLALNPIDQQRYDEYVKNFNSGQGGNQNSQGQGGNQNSPGQNNFGPGGPGNGPGGPGQNGPPGRPPFGQRGQQFGGPGGGPGGRGGQFGGPGGPRFGPGGPNGQNPGGAGGGDSDDDNSIDSYSGGDNQEAISMVKEAINDGNYSPDEKVALKYSAPEIAREFVHKEEERAGYGGSHNQSPANYKITPIFGNIMVFLSLTHIFRLIH